MKIKHLLFDLDDTLFPTYKFAELARKNALNAMISLGLDYKQEKLYKMLQQIIIKKSSNYPFHFNDLCKKLKIKNPEKYIAAAVVAYHNTKAAIHSYPEVKRVLLDLKSQGYKIYCASRGTPLKQWDKLIRLGLALFFDDVFITSTKSSKYYKSIIKKLKANPKECIMIGDKPDIDIYPAKKVGLRTIRMKRGKYKKLKSKADIELNDFYQLKKALNKFKD